jgi:hypothetical protein
MLENYLIDGIHATRYIASWLNVGGMLHSYKDYDNFHNWLLSLNLNKDQAQDILELAWMGKFELERNAEDFLKKLKSE